MESSFRGQSISPRLYHILHIILHIKLRRNTGGTGILDFSKEIQTSSMSSHENQIILAILTVVFTLLYLLWGTNTGICRVFVYLLFLSNLLGESGHIGPGWKGLGEENAAPIV